MDSRQLAEWQIEKLFKRIQQELRFLDKLESRMRQTLPRQGPNLRLDQEGTRAGQSSIGAAAVQLSYLKGPR